MLNCFAFGVAQRKKCFTVDKSKVIRCLGMSVARPGGLEDLESDDIRDMRILEGWTWSIGEDWAGG